MARKAKFSQSEIEAIQTRHNEGESMRSIARSLRVSDATIRVNIKARGIKDQFGRPVINSFANKKPDLIYLITSEEFAADGFYKIGISSNVEYRLGQLQTGCPYLLKAVITAKVKNPLAIEFMLHSFFGKKRVKGEWFKLTLEDISYLTETLNHIDESENGKAV